MPKSIMTIVGARPQFVKAAAVSRVIKEDGYFEEKIVLTLKGFLYSMNFNFFLQILENMKNTFIKISIRVSKCSNCPQSL